MHATLKDYCSDVILGHHIKKTPFAYEQKPHLNFHADVASGTKGPFTRAVLTHMI